jgi:hypothetical protein
MAQQPMDRIPQLVEKVKKLREERDEKIKVLDDGVVAAEAELKAAVDAIQGTLNEALGAIGQQRKSGGHTLGKGGLMKIVEPLVAQGMSVNEIAKETGRSVSTVHSAIKRIHGRDTMPAAPLPPPRPIPAPSFGDRATVASPPPPPARTNGLADEDDGGASLDDLRRAVISTKGGTKARLLTTLQRGHKHIADVNRDGNGYTATSGKDGHVHAVKAFVLGAGPDGHRHDLTTDAA